MSGEADLEADHDQGSWADPQNGLICSLTSGDDMVVSVSLSTVASTGASDFAQLLERSRTAHNAAEIIADEQGEGFVHESDGFVEARWVCGQAYFAVDVHTTAPKRDALKDVSRYVISMLPWACGGENPPKRTSAS